LPYGKVAVTAEEPTAYRPRAPARWVPRVALVLLRGADARV